MALTLLHPSTAAVEPQVDLVAVHGLNGDPIKTWTHPKTGACWLKDEEFLPQDMPGARIFTFGYNADMCFGKTTAEIVDHAGALLSSIIDEREDDRASRRPLIFIAHSLGGIVVKEALLQARLDKQYESINKATRGIIFLGTPHRGSDKANYGKVLANIATSALNIPSPRLLGALQTNSPTLFRLTSDFQHQLPMYQIVSVYEMKPTGPLKTLIVEKHSALLQVTNEEAISSDTNHESICKFEARDNPVYKKISKRVNRMVKQHGATSESTSNTVMKNKYYNVPRSASSQFTGREDIAQRLLETCSPNSASKAQTVQKRFVLYGLGGSGKTQVCLKFAQVHREKYWGVFWLDGSSHQTINQGLQGIADMCGFKHDASQIVQWLSRCEHPWLLIIDNADDPYLDISQYFPPGNRGTVLLTTRNRECKVHATIGSFEFDRMPRDDAITLLLKYAAIESSEATRHSAESVAETLGFLALALAQAGAYIRQGLCRLEEYCEEYLRRREELLKYRSVQTQREYEYTVYTTWEISFAAIGQMESQTSRNALSLLHLFSFWHFEGISEDIFRDSWINIREKGWLEHLNKLKERGWLEQTSEMSTFIPWDGDSTTWNPKPFREAIALLSSFSLISVDGVKRHISLHPLVHTWAQDRMTANERSRFWRLTTTTLAASLFKKTNMDISDINQIRQLLPHITCSVNYTNAEWDPATAVIVREFMYAYEDFRLWRECRDLGEGWLEQIRAELDDEHLGVLDVMIELGVPYEFAGPSKKSVDFIEQLLESSEKLFSDEHPIVIALMLCLAKCYVTTDPSKAVELAEQVVMIRTKNLKEEHPDTLYSLDKLAEIYEKGDQPEKCLLLREKVLRIRTRTLGEGQLDTLYSMCVLAFTYFSVGRANDALTLFERTKELTRLNLGDSHSLTLETISWLSYVYHKIGDREQDACRLAEQVVKLSKEAFGDDHPKTLEYEAELATMLREMNEE